MDLRAAALALIVGSSLLVTTSADADVIVLQNGNRIRGKILAEVGETVEVQLPYGTMRLQRRQIRTIERETDGEYLERTGEKLLQHRDLDKGLEFLRRAHAEKPTGSTLRSLLKGLTLRTEQAIENRRYREAQRFVKEGLELDTSHPALVELSEKITHFEQRLAALEAKFAAAEIEQKLPLAFDTAREIMQRFPEVRETYRAKFGKLCILRGHEELRAQRYSEARALYHDGLAHDPDLIEYARVPLGFCEVKSVVPILEDGDFNRARTNLREAHEILPGHPAVIYYLGLVEEGTGNLARAAELYSILAGPNHDVIRGPAHLKELRTLAESQLASASSFDLEAPKKRWEDAPRSPGVLETANFVIHHTVAERAREVGQHLEHHLKRMRKKWFRGAMPLRRKVQVYLHPDDATFRLACAPPVWSSGLTRNEYRFDQCFGHEMHFDASAPQFQSSTLPHELCHVLLPHVVGDGVRPPLWVDEGLATTEEPGFKQRYFDRVVADALADDRCFTALELFTAKEYPAADRARLFYAQSNSISRFLIAKLGLRETLAFVRDIAEGPVEQVVREHEAFESIAHLDTLWRRWLTRRR